MTAFFEQLVNFIGDNPALAGIICFAAAMGEALFIIGLVVPSTVILVGAGTFIGLGKLDGLEIFLWTAIGATAGDAASYWFGHFYKEKVRNIWPLSRYPAFMDKGEAFFREHGGKSIFIGRFVPGVKSVVPGIAGMVGMNATRFTIINVTSAIAWTAAHLAPGVIAGTALGALGQISGRLAIVVGGLCLIAFLVVMLGRWMILIIMPLFPNAHAAIVAWFAKRPDRFSRWIATTFDPEHPRSTGMLVSAIALLITMPLFFWLMGKIAPGAPMVRADIAILNMFADLRTPIGDKLMTIITMLGDGVVVVVLSVTVAVYLFIRKAWRRSIGFIIAMSGTAVFVPLFKTFLERSRPIDIYSGAQAFSFPSGHATLNTVLFGICAVLIAHDRSRWAKASIFTITATYVIAISFSRVYLGVHWMSDVLAGLLFGSAMVAAFGFVFGPIHNEKVDRITLSALVIAVLVSFGFWHVQGNLNDMLESYKPRTQQQLMAYEKWQTTGWANMPGRRIEITGKNREPLVLQYAGKLSSLVSELEKDGWKQAPKWSISSASGFIESQTPAEALPALPRTHNGHQPALTLIKVSADPEKQTSDRWVLRLWPSTTFVVQGTTKLPLFVGSVLHENIERLMGEFSRTQTDRQSPSFEENPFRLLPGVLSRHRQNGIDVLLATAPEGAKNIPPKSR